MAEFELPYKAVGNAEFEVNMLICLSSLLSLCNMINIHKCIFEVESLSASYIFVYFIYHDLLLYFVITKCGAITLLFIFRLQSLRDKLQISRSNAQPLSPGRCD